MNMQNIFLNQKEQCSHYIGYAQRIEMLKKMRLALKKNRDDLVGSVQQDFGHRSVAEIELTEILTSISLINYVLKHLKSWIKKEKRKVSWLYWPAKNSILYQPKGAVGIIVPWNYPLFLSLGPLIYAIAAGNRTMIKMSEYTPNTASAFEQWIKSLFDMQEVAVIQGDQNIAKQFSQLPFDHLFFTGSTSVGKKIMQAAAQNLTPVTLELGGKSPVIIDSNYSIKQAARKIVFAKLINAGQTCVAPDYIYCPKNKQQELIKEMLSQATTLYPNGLENADYSSIINYAQFNRLKSYIEDAQEKGANIHQNQALDDKSKKIPLTILSNVSEHMKIMQEEIFGPLFPITCYDHINEVIDSLINKNKPLALYLFSDSTQVQQMFLQSTHSGGISINEALVHVCQDDLPFGGVGHSGMGSYHSKEGFTTLSHAKAIHKKGFFDTTGLAYPPHNRLIQRIIKRLFL